MSRPDGSTTIRPARSDDVAPLATLHRQCFPDYQSSRLGMAFCRRLFETYLERPDVAVHVAVGDDQLLQGYFVGATADTQREVTRSLTRWAALASLGQLIKSPSKIAQVVTRGRRLLRSQPTRRSSTPPDVDQVHPAPTDADPPEPTSFRLVLIAVVKAARGAGVSGALLDQFVEQASSRGFILADLVVEESNHSAQRCYLRYGWELVAHDPGDPSVRYQLQCEPT